MKIFVKVFVLVVLQIQIVANDPNFELHACFDVLDPRS